MFVLLVLYVINGELQQEEYAQPDYKTCLNERQMLLRTANREMLPGLEVHCVVRDPNASPKPGF